MAISESKATAKSGCGEAVPFAQGKPEGGEWELYAVSADRSDFESVFWYWALSPEAAAKLYKATDCTDDTEIETEVQPLRLVLPPEVFSFDDFENVLQEVIPGEDDCWCNHDEGWYQGAAAENVSEFAEDFDAMMLKHGHCFLATAKKDGPRVTVKLDIPMAPCAKDDAVLQSPQETSPEERECEPKS